MRTAPEGDTRRKRRCRFLLAAGEPPAVSVIRPSGRSAYVLVCDHAANRLPRALGTLGLPPSERRRHIAWDLGAAEVARGLSAALDAVLIAQNYSRLAIDANRRPWVASSIVAVSERTAIPGNRHIAAAGRGARRRALFDPYHRRIAAELDARLGRGRPAILVAVHSFTPRFKGKARPWHVGLLYNRDRRLAGVLGDLLRREGDLVVGDNQPYAVSDATDYTLPVHGERRAIPHVGLEIRQDLLATASQRAGWVERLARLLRRAEGMVADAEPTSRKRVER